MTNEALITALKRRFITRADAKAIQSLNGDYRPVRDKDSNLIPWSNNDLAEHLAEEQTYGHYMLSRNSQCKLFAFDIDLSGTLASYEVEIGEDRDVRTLDIIPRNEWKDRSSPLRDFFKRQMRLVGQELANIIHTELQLETAIAYSGSKGIHVYGFLGKSSGDDCVDAAQIVTDLLEGWKKHPSFPMLYVWDKYPHFNFEVFPKQRTISGDGFGNLMRLPLGRNFNSPKDPTFFVDLTAPLGELKPADSLWALTDGAKNPWKKPSE